MGSHAGNRNNPGSVSQYRGSSCSIFDLPFLQQPRPAVGANVRKCQLGCCDSLHGEGCVVSATGVQAALLADVGASGRLRVAPCAAPYKRPILSHGSFRISSQVQAALNRLLFDCHRWGYDTQLCETAKQDDFGWGFGPETDPRESVSSNAPFLRRPGDRHAPCATTTSWMTAATSSRYFLSSADDSLNLNLSCFCSASISASSNRADRSSVHPPGMTT